MGHPFVTKQVTARLVGEAPLFDVFISYRVTADESLAERLYHRLTALNVRVWLDKMCLKDGEKWEEGFCAGLVTSAVFVLTISGM